MLQRCQEHSAVDHAPGRGRARAVRHWKRGSPSSKRRSKDAADTAPSPPGPALPRLEFKALRLIPWGWGEGWQLRPSPPRRHWMDELPHAYKCLPLVIANQWGWQILCPTDVVVTWNGDPNLAGLQIDVAPQYLPAIKSQFGSGIVTFSPPWLFRTPPGWDLYLKGPSNRWKPNCVSAGRRDRDLVAQLHLHAELEARRAGYGLLRPRREPGPARAGPTRHLSRRHGTRSTDRCCSNPRRPKNFWNGKNGGGSWPARRSMSINSIERPRESRNTFSASTFRRSSLGIVPSVRICLMGTVPPVEIQRKIRVTGRRAWVPRCVAEGIGIDTDGNEPSPGKLHVSHGA